MTKISIISALSKNYVIGNKGDLPWHIPEDFKLFKEKTRGKPVIMGRKTWESLPLRPLPGRKNIVISRNPESVSDDCEVCTSLQEAISLATSSTQPDSPNEIFIIGGSQIYKQAIDEDLVTHLYLSHVKKEVEGDTFFPEFNKNNFKVIEEKDFEDFTFRIYERILS